ncbi:hypothetical protein PVAP13_5NG627812 [Panicum virgatum]|uniref:Uncharacterized protein n=1 Tax=Panicum virgatum TaxID=38727 RepID=A0A8T0SBA3_PANVG|nr:hypothetical protein PVAP13_5NG627812 [Panicum virgatum]
MGKGRRRPGRGRGWGGCVAPLSLSASVFWDTRGPVRSEAVLFQNSGRQLTMYYYKVGFNQGAGVGKEATSNPARRNRQSVRQRLVP